MAVTGTLSMTGVISGLLTGTKNVSVQWAITTGVGQISAPLNLANGDNTITVPTGTTVIIFNPATGNANVLKIKGNAGDTGVQIHKTLPTVLTWDAAGSLIINAAGATNGCEISFC